MFEKVSKGKFQMTAIEIAGIIDYSAVEICRRRGMLAPPDPKGVPYRLRLLQKYAGAPTQTAMAAMLGISVFRWHNFLRRSPLSRAVEDMIVMRFPGITRDWLRDGDTRGMPHQLVERLRELEQDQTGL
jgi:hypothetical protein